MRSSTIALLCGGFVFAGILAQTMNFFVAMMAGPAAYSGLAAVCMAILEAKES